MEPNPSSVNKEKVEAAVEKLKMNPKFLEEIDSLIDNNLDALRLDLTSDEKRAAFLSVLMGAWGKEVAGFYCFKFGTGHACCPEP